MIKKTFPREQEERPVNPQKPEIEKPAEPIGPGIPQEDPLREPSEVPPSPSAPPSPGISPNPVPNTPQG
jgi:hypothetical protein